MMNLKLWATGLALLAFGSYANAQNETDALRYSYLSFGGTARIQGIAGAQTALGADASNLAVNPAGLGFYRKSEFTITPGFTFNNTDSFLGSTVTPGSRNNFNIPQLGIVFSNRKADDVISDWRGGSFGMAYTRLNSFQANTSYSGTVSDDRSFLQSLQDQIDNGSITPQSLNDEFTLNNSQYTSLGGLAYYVYLIDTTTVNGPLEVYVPGRVGTINQREDIFSRGSQNQFDFSYGTSYRDKLYIGGSIGIATIDYEQSRTYTETSGSDEPYLSSLVITDFFETNGAGINFKVGLIYKPTDALRIGGAIQTPTFYSMEDFYTTSLQANYTSRAVNENIVPQSSLLAQTPDGIFEYNLTTPFRANGGLAYIFEKYGFISADIEYVGYGGASFSTSNDNATGLNVGTSHFNEQNRLIETTYDGAVNYRVGAEGRMDVFRIRAGYARYGDAFKSSNLDRTRNYYTFGIGLKETKFFLDAAYVHSAWDSYYSPYTLNDNSQPIVKTENTNANFVFTAGFNF